MSGTKSFSNIHSEINEKSIQSKINIPTSLDWRTEGVITPVYNHLPQTKDATIVAVGEYS